MKHILVFQLIYQTRTYSKGGARVKKKKFFRKLSFVLIMSLVCTLMPLGYGHEEVQAATAGANAFARLSAYVADDGLYILSKSFFTTYSSHSAWAAYYYQDRWTPEGAYRCSGHCGNGCYTSNHFRYIGWASIPTCTSSGIMYIGCNQGQIGYGPNQIGVPNGCVKYGQVTIPAFGHSYSGEEYVYNGNFVKDCAYCGRVVQRSATYTISFNGNDATNGAAMENITGTYGQATSVPANKFRRTGYTFAGWSTSKDGSVVVGDGKTYTQNSINAVTLYAQWTKNSYQINYNPNGASGTMNPTLTSYDTATALSPLLFTRPGYSFKNWRLAGTETTFENGETVSNLSALVGLQDQINPLVQVTLNAQWEANKYHVTYHGCEGTIDINGAAEYVKEEVYDDSPERRGVDLSVTATMPGMEFVGWNTDKNAKTNLVTLDLQPNDIHLYAIYSIPVSDVNYVEASVWSEPDYSDKTSPAMMLTGIENLDYAFGITDWDISAVIENIAQSGNSLQYNVTAWDNAGNVNSWGDSAPITKWFTQTVAHREYDREMDSYGPPDSDTVDIKEGDTFIPQPRIEKGYYLESMENADGYEVHGNVTSLALYHPCEYTLYFDPNTEGGTIEPASKMIYYMDRYNDLPTPEKEGYTFTGWHRADGTLVKAEDYYTIDGDSTLYAKWQVNQHTVHYNYRENDGTAVQQEFATVNYGEPIDLSVEATKTGWEFVGWNTDKTAREGLTFLLMPDNDVTLYAIYKKNITITFVDVNTYTETYTIYKTDEKAPINIRNQDGLGGAWKGQGWTTSEAADAKQSYYSANTTRDFSEDTSLYGIYKKMVSVEFDSTEARLDLPDAEGIAYYNCSGNRINPYVTTHSITLDGFSFVTWEDVVNQKEYEAGQTYEFPDSVTLKAIWDEYPKIEAYSRYFTLDESQNGSITQTELLEKVKGTDREDGELQNGTDVIVKDYDSSIFTSITEDKSVEIIYQATDSFGNVTTKSITINIVDTSVKESQTEKYVRFINKDFFTGSDGTLINASKGGLEETSLWRTDSSRLGMLQQTLTNSKSNVEKKEIKAFGNEWEVEVAGSGEWTQEEEVWEFKHEDLENMKEFTDEYGQAMQALDVFAEMFGDCKKN